MILAVATFLLRSGCMHRNFLGGVALVLALSAAEPGQREEDRFYKLGPDSLLQEGVPQGKLNGPFTLPCNVFPGTQHTYWVFVPAQYDAKTPASLMVFNDGQAFIHETGDARVPNVLNNLIYR